MKVRRRTQLLITCWSHDSHTTHLDLLQVNLQHSGQLSHGRVLVNGDKYLVEERLKVVSLDPVHHETLGGKWRVGGKVEGRGQSGGEGACRGEGASRREGASRGEGQSGGEGASRGEGAKWRGGGK